MRLDIEGKCVFLNMEKIFFLYKHNKSLWIISEINKEPKKIEIKDEVFFNSKNMRFSDIGKEQILTFKSKTNYYIAKINNLKIEKPKIFNLKETSVIIKHNKEYIAYYGDNVIKIAVSKDMEKWKKLDTIICKRKTYFDNGKLQIGGVKETKEGILLFYYSVNKNNYSIGALLFDKKNPEKILWRTEQALLEINNEKKIKPVGIIYNDTKLISYWQKTNEIIVSENTFVRKETFPDMKKYKSNPIIKPNAKNKWESEYTFNTAAIEHKGKVHFIYRATGKSMISVFGYAQSKDGLKIIKRLDKPAYVHKCSTKINNTSLKWRSGYGIGGCEDPRMTKIHNTIYMLYTLFDGYPRVAITSINLKDFLKNNWKWKNPVIISPPNEVHKNWAIFPEKINGKYAMIHSITPEILIEYFDSLEFTETQYIKSQHIPVRRKNCWDNHVRGIGPPPLKTKDGWLVFYHAISESKPGKYLLGAMLLDLNNPEKILYRSINPILIPNMHYENNGFKPGIVYSCGNVILGDEIIVYYGGADSVVCAAKAKLNKFLTQLKTKKEIILKPLEISRWKYDN